MSFDRLKKWIVKTWEYDCSHLEWLVAKIVLFCMCMGLFFMFLGWKIVGEVFFWTVFGVLVIRLMILFLLVLLEDERRKTPIPNMRKIGNALGAELANIVQTNGNPVDVLSKTFGAELTEFSTSMDAKWFVPTLHKIETAGIPGPWGRLGSILSASSKSFVTGLVRRGLCKQIRSGFTSFLNARNPTRLVYGFVPQTKTPWKN